MTSRGKIKKIIAIALSLVMVTGMFPVQVWASPMQVTFVSGEGMVHTLGGQYVGFAPVNFPRTAEVAEGESVTFSLSVTFTQALGEGWYGDGEYIYGGPPVIPNDDDDNYDEDEYYNGDDDSDYYDNDKNSEDCDYYNDDKNGEGDDPDDKDPNKGDENHPGDGGDENGSGGNGDNGGNGENGDNGDDGDDNGYDNGSGKDENGENNKPGENDPADGEPDDENNPVPGENGGNGNNSYDNGPDPDYYKPDPIYSENPLTVYRRGELRSPTANQVNTVNHTLAQPAASGRTQFAPTGDDTGYGPYPDYAFATRVTYKVVRTAYIKDEDGLKTEITTEFVSQPRGLTVEFIQAAAAYIGITPFMSEYVTTWQEFFDAVNNPNVSEIVLEADIAAPDTGVYSMNIIRPLTIITDEENTINFGTTAAMGVSSGGTLTLGTMVYNGPTIILNSLVRYSFNVVGGSVVMNGGVLAYGQVGIVLQVGGSDFTMNGGRILYNEIGVQLGGIGTTLPVAFNMYGGEIESNNAGNGAVQGVGVLINALGVFTMNGGSISGSEYGVVNNNYFFMYNGRISDNYRVDYDVISGAGVYNFGVFIMNDGYIDGNGIFGVINRNLFTLDGGTISNHRIELPEPSAPLPPQAYSSGGTGVVNVVHLGGVFTMRGGLITANDVGIYSFAAFVPYRFKASINNKKIKRQGKPSQRL